MNGDGLLKKSGGDGLPLEERARLGCLPDELNLADIALLFYSDNPEGRRALEGVLLEAVLSKTLRADFRLLPGEERVLWAMPPFLKERWPDIAEYPLWGGEESRPAECWMVHKEDLRHYLKAKEEPLPDWWFPAMGEPEQQAMQPPEPQQAKPKGTRKDRMRVAIEAAEEALQGKTKRRPTADEVFDYLANDRDETGVIVDYTSEKLTWTDSKGKCHDIDRPTFANRLSRYRQPNHT